MDSNIIYLFTFAVVLLMAHLFDKCFSKNEKSGKVFLVFIFLILTLLLGFRQQVGTDYQSYISAFNWGYGFDFGSKTIFSVLRSVTSWTQAPILFYAILNNLILILSMFEMRKTGMKITLPMAAYLFLFFPFSFNIIRQSLAMLMLLLAYALNHNNHRIRSVIAMLAAITVHSSAIIAIPFFAILTFIKQEKQPRAIKILSVATLIILLFLPRISEVLTNAGITSYTGYISRLDIQTIDYELVLSYVPILLLILLCRHQLNNPFIKTTAYLTTFGIFTEILLSSSSAISRIGLYFSIYSIFLLPTLITSINNVRTRKVLLMLFVAYIVGYFIVVYYIHGRAGIFPYRNLLF